MWSWLRAVAESLGAIRLSPEPFASIQLVVADLDGSLIESNSREVAERLGDLVVSVMQFNTAFTIATGRTLNWITGIQPLSTLLNWYGTPRNAMPVVLYNGSVVFDGADGLLQANQIELGALRSLLALLEDASLPALCYTGPSDETLFSVPSERVVGCGAPIGDHVDINGLQIEWQAGYSVGELRPVAVLVPLRGVQSETAAMLDKAIRAIPGVSATRSGLSYIEVRPAGSNKASGLSVVAERLGIPQESILAIGDNDNDVEMLRWAGVGVSVQGASEAAVAASDFVCPGGAVEGANQVLGIIRSARRAARGR